MSSERTFVPELRALVGEALRSGTVGGLAMIPFAALFRAFGLRINEYGRKTLALVVGDVAPPLHYALTLAQHLVISWVAAMPLLWLLARIDDRRTRVLVGALYGATFYVVVNAWRFLSTSAIRPPGRSASRLCIPALPSTSSTAS